LPAPVQQISSHATCTVRWTAVPFIKLHSLFGNDINYIMRVCV